MREMRKGYGHILIVLVSAWTLVPAIAEEQRREGEIGGAKFIIVAPEEPKGKLLLLAHGYRAENNPLSAGFAEDGSMTKSLLARGWIVASTSFRRNGWIIEDAIDDLEKLRARVEEEFGKQARCVVHGNSMGGLIVVRAAEGALSRVDGGVAIGAALKNHPKPEPYPKLTFKPNAPIIFLTNETELGDPKMYRGKEGGAQTALWEVKRPGHCNVSEAERLAAVLAVDAWIDGREPELERDGTVPPPKRKSTAQMHEGALQGTVTHLSESWGNLVTDFVQADLDHLQINLRDPLVVESDGGRLEVTFCRHYRELPAGKAVAFVTAEGWLRVQINGKRASEVLKLKKGDQVRLKAKD